MIAGYLASGTLLDEGMVYFDARLSRNHPTVEVRVADVCLYTEDAILIAALVRALVETAAGEWRRGVPVRPVPAALLRLALWRASRSGMNGDLLHPVDNRPRPAAAIVAVRLAMSGPPWQMPGTFPGSSAEWLRSCGVAPGNDGNAPRSPARENSQQWSPRRHARHPPPRLMRPYPGVEALRPD